MEYELAKELKDAGFPQFDTQFAWADVNIGGKNWEKRIVPNNFQADIEFVAAPTLPELIDACGDRFFCLQKKETVDGGHWLALGSDNYGAQTGKTCKVAVAKLYIEIKEIRDRVTKGEQP